jgi:hypothetical protein
MIFRSLFGVLLLGVIMTSSAHGEDAESWVSDEAESQFDEAGSLLGYGDSPLTYDDQIDLAQAASPSGPSRSMSTRTASRAGRTSRVPYMIGDSPESPNSSASLGMAPSIGFQGIPIAEAEHPILFGSKFNAAENASSFPTDRVYANYRHFAGAHDVNVLGQQSSLPLERLDVGFEKTAFDGLMSVELRVPTVRQLNSDLAIFSGPGGDNLPVSDRHGELGNLGVNLKLLLFSRPTYGVSAGVGVTCPTGEDAHITMSLDEPDFVIAQSPLVSSTAPTNLTFVGQFDNDTVNLVPYLAWFVRPSRFFHQGFLQIDTPLNRSDASVLVSGEITPDSTFSPETFNVYQTGELDQQTLLRLNAGFGYWICQGERGGPLRGLAALFETHYTTALDDAKPFVVPVTTLDAVAPGVADVPLNVVAGPTANNVDIVNLTAGVVADLGSCQITNGFIVPVTEGEDRQFDFEYSLQMNHRF